MVMMLDKVRAGPLTTSLTAGISDYTSSLLELAWSLTFAGKNFGTLGDLLQSGLLAMAQSLDDRSRHDALLACEAADMGPAWQGELPRVVLDLRDIVVVLKPPHWEVDAHAGGHSERCEASGAPLLSSFLRARFSRHDHPLLHCSQHQFGIIHRLDAPSSGLILAGKNFKGYYVLRWQQDTYELGREYLVLCHGRMAWGPRVISARVKTSRTIPATSTVSEDGKPAWTQVEPLCVLKRATDEEYTLLAVVIRTGRTHQIRVHLKHIGHATVTDSKYTEPAMYNKDRSWCLRNFLHRCRLTFQDTDQVLHEATAPLPEDLVTVLRSLRPVDDGRSSAAQQEILARLVPSSAGLAQG